MRSYPSDWQVIRLAEAGTWLSGGTPPTANPRYWNGDIPWISAASLKAFEISDSDRNVTELGISAGTRVVPRDTILFVVRGMSLKKEFRIGITTTEVAFGQDCKALIPRGDLDARFLAHALSAHFHEVLGMVDESGHGTGRLPTDQLGKLSIDVPPLPEQRRIAEILDSLDESIRTNEQLIFKRARARQGLIDRLLTKGLAPERCRFKKTPIGMLPIHWGVVPIGAVLAPVAYPMRSGPFGSELLKSELSDAGIPLLGIDNVLPEEFLSSYTRFVSYRKYLELGRYEVMPGDILITIMGTVGRCCVVPEDVGTALSSKHVWALSLDQNRYLPELACLQINYSSWVQRHFRRDTQGGIMSAIRSDTLRTTLLPCPPLDEQRQILAVLRAHSSTTEREVATVHKLRRAKQGLMEDLLTGRVRVSEAKKVVETVE